MSVGARCVAVLKYCLLVVCLTGLAPNVWADSFNVSDFELSPTSGPNDPGDPNQCVLDGPGAVANDGRIFDPADQLSIDRSCTIRNFSCSDPLASTLNFASHVPGTLIIFNNVCYEGNFACANVSGSAFVWAVNGSDFSSVKEGCQDLIIPVEKIDKSATDLSDNPITSVSVGVPFRYTLDVPILFDPVSGTVIPGYGSLNELGNIVITDDLTPGTLGVDLELIDITVSSDTTGLMTEGPDYTVTSSIGNPSDPGVLTFTIINPDPLPANDQIHISIDVVLKDTPLNNIGKIFTNVAEWTFSRYIDGVLYDPLPGENGVAQLLSISQPDLLVDKTTSASAVNFSDLPDFTIFVQNIGGAPAWNIVVEDQLPLEMQDFDPSATVTVTLDGTLLDPSDYVVNYSPGGSPGLLSVELLDSAGALAPNAILRIDYTSQLDQPGGSNEPADGDLLTNVAAATLWYNDSSSNGSRVEYIGARTDGTVGTDDNQDAVEITAALTGYYFEKTVTNVTTGISPATTAIPGDRLRYRVRLFNLDQEIYDVAITDQLDPTRFDISSATVDASTCPIGASTCAFDGSGLLTVSGDIDVAPSSAQQSISIEFEVDLLGTLADGDIASNQAELNAADVNAGALNINAFSDDPNVNGVINQAAPTGPSDTTDIAIIAPGALLKENPVGLTETPIGETFTYTLTVPQTAVNAPLYDVQVQDALPGALEPTSALATATIIDAVGTPTGTIYNLSITDTGSGLVLSENVTGLDLAAGERALISLEVQVSNELGNQDGGSYTNTATWSYARINGGVQSDPTGTDSTTAALTIVEPDVTALKTVTNLDANSPAQGGDTLEYTVTLTNGGTSTAFDTSIVDTLPAGLTYVAGSGEITLNAATTQVEPSVVGNVLTWGSQNADGSLDIPVGESLVLTYQVVITDATGPDLINLADITWSSLNGPVDGERTGADAPDAAGLNDYFTTATSTVTYADTTNFAKTVQADSWNDGGVLSTGTDGILRVGDTVTYALTLGLREGTTSAVTVTDTLPTGLEVVSVNYVFDAANISFTPVTAPLAGDRGVLSWDLGAITNTPDAVTTNDTLVIELVAVVVANDADTLAQINTTVVNNAAELNYTGAAAPLTGNVDITVDQPVMSAITKIDTAGGRTGAGTNADPYQIDLLADTMSFQLQTCNNGDAPAYNVAISDTLADQLDEADLATAPTVTLGGAPLTVVTDFVYTAPARAGAFTITLNDGVPVDPAECLVVSYDIGFHDDVITSTAFNNDAALDAYWSLDSSAGQQYPDTSSAQVWMINNVVQPLPVKDVIGQADGVVVIGESVSYTVTVPADNINRASVTITDTLPDALLYDSASATVNGLPVAITDGTVGQDVSINVGDVPAGQETVVTLVTHVANTTLTNSGDSIDNTASYTYTGLVTPLTSAAAPTLTIVESLLGAAKSVANLTNPGNPAAGGDELEYTITLTNSGNATAFDTTVTDTLPTGLTLIASSATAEIGPAGSTVAVAGFVVDPTVSGSDLIWGNGNADAALDIPAGEVLVLSYRVNVTDVAIGSYTNSVLADWGSLDAASALERTGAGCPTITAPNDYCAGPATANITSVDTTAFAKVVAADSWDDGGVLSTATDSTLRVGDTVDYTLTLTLREGLTSAVTVSDTLPTGLVFDSVIAINGDNSAPYSNVAPFTHTDIAAPSVVGNVITWTIGDITNAVDNNTANDSFVIQYRARVANGAVLAQQASTVLANAASLSYDSGIVLNDTVDIDVRQPVISAITKIDGLGNSYPNPGAPLIVDIVNDVMSFTLETCNAALPAAPAYNLQLVDTLASELDESSIVIQQVTINGASATDGVEYTYTPPAVRGGDMVFDINDPLNAGQCVTVEYDIGFYTDTAANQFWANSVQASEYWSLPTPTTDGEQYAAVGPAEFWMSNAGTDPLPVKTVVQPVAPDVDVTIGDSVVYTITIPSISAVRDNVVITDTLEAALAYDSASATVGGVPTALTDNTAGQNVDLTLAQIPAGQDAVITLTTHVVNTTGTNAGDTFRNEATYTYTGLATPLTGAPSEQLTIVEPQLAIAKAVANLTNPGNPAAGGDVLEYTVTLTNTGAATAFDTTVTDTLPVGLTLVASSATAEIGPAGSTVAVAGFNADPAVSGSDLIWGNGNADETLDIPAGEVLVLTYQANVSDASIGTYTNSVLADWGSQDAVSALERTGAGCPTITAPDDYCAGPATSTITSIDTTALAKAVIADSWDDAYSTANDSIVRVGDSIDYELTLTLREGLTSAVVVSDTLPTGLVFDSVIAINGDTSAPYSNVAPFTHADIAAPSVVGNVISWNIGDITNAIDNNTANDTFVIQYRARVANGSVLTQQTTTTLDNAAAVSYDTSAVINATPVSIDVYQPLMSALSKIDGTATAYTNPASPLVVDIANDVMSFTLETCNAAAPAAPAYNLQLVDTLASELDESTLSVPQVTINGALATAGVGYVYTPPAGRGGTMTFDLLTPVEAGQCATVTYDIGFYTDTAPNQTWTNNVDAPEYWSLPTPTTDGEQYGPAGATDFWMTNASVDPLPLKDVLLPVAPDTDVTIGEAVSYTVTVPAINAARSAVTITDTLPDVLVYDSASATVNALPVAIVDGTAGQDVSINVGDVPAGQEVVVTINAYVANTTSTNAGDTVDNTASYTYTGLAAPLTSAAAPTLTIVEPVVGIVKTVENLTNPGSPAAGGDELEYTLTLTNTGTATAFDSTVTDTLPTGLTLVASSATAAIGPAGSTVAVAGFVVDPTVNGADLIWGNGNADETLDIPAGEVLELTFRATVGAASGTIDNIAYGDWTSLDAVSALERTGAGCPTIVAPDDYCAGPATVSINTAADVDVTKTVFNVTTGQPGTTASPGDVLEYTITIDNRNSISLPDFSLLDDPGSWNTDLVFVSGSMTSPVVVGSTFTDASVLNGGTNGAGLIDLRNLVLGPDGGGADIVTVTFQITLASVITNGTTVENRSAISANGATITPFDPATGIAQTLIASAPAWQVQKISDDLTGDVAVLEAGDTLRYTITVANIGNEDAISVTLRDAIPNFTTYIAGSTTLNGLAVADVGGTSALVAGMPINAASNSTAGVMEADATAPADHIATIVFQVQVNAGTLPGTIIANQGFVYGTGEGGTAFTPAPSDDPATAVVNDPTQDIVGGLPLLDAQKTVALVVDGNGDGVVNTGETLRYTITLTNNSAIDATMVTLSDTVPVNSAFVPGSVTIDTVAQPDPASAPTSIDLDIGTVAAGTSVVVTFDVTVTGVAGDVISNQGVIDSLELPAELTDADGIDSNGDQPTTIVVGSDQQVSIVKSVAVVGGGVAVAGSELEYVVQVTNTGVVAATFVQITDDLNAFIAATQGDYVAGSATLNGATLGVNYVGQILTADFYATYGDLAPGASAELRFRVVLDASVVAGDVISNTGTVYWNNPALNASSTVTTTVGSIPGVAALTGTVWHDADFNNALDGGEVVLPNWTVSLYRAGVLQGTTVTDANGLYSFSGLAPTVVGTDLYELRFVAPNATATTAMLGYAASAFTNDLQRITDIAAGYGATVSGLNLPIDPNGVVYNSILRTPVAGARLELVNSLTGSAVSSSCFADPQQQGQVTLASGYYKFDLIFGDASCLPNSDYLIQVTPPASGYVAGQSQIIAPLTDATTAAYSVPACASDAILGGLCEAQVSEFQPGTAVPAGDPTTGYYLNLTFSDGATPDDNQIFNNHIALDPTLANTVGISKTSAMVNVSRGQLVPYVIRVSNTLPVTLADMNVVDSFPAGFKYVESSARIDGVPVEPTVVGRQLTWSGLSLATNNQMTIKLLFAVSAGVSEGEYINRAQVFNAVTGAAASAEANATVRVVPDPTFDCTDVIGKVFDDANYNGVQDENEKGLPGVRLVTARGLLITTDEFGRYHITCAVVPDENRGSNFIVKVDDRSLPTGYRMTTENPRVQRVTRGKMQKFNFGAALHRVVRLDLGDGVFDSGDDNIRRHWLPRFDLLINELVRAPSILRLGYMAENERPALVEQRLDAIKQEVRERWRQQGNPYELIIETEVFWRTGSPPSRRASQ